MIFRKCSGCLQLLPHISGQVFIRGLPAFCHRVFKDHPGQFLRHFFLCFPGKLCHKRHVHFGPFPDRHRQGFACRIHGCYRLRLPNCPFGKDVGFPFQVPFFVQDLQGREQAVAAVLGKGPLVGIAADQPVSPSKLIVCLI